MAPSSDETSEGARRVPMFPLSGVLLPHLELSIHVFEPRYQQLTADCLAGERELGIVLIARGSEVGGGDERMTIGTLAHLEEAVPLDGGRWALRLHGRRRLRVRTWLDDAPYPVAVAEELPERPPRDVELAARSLAAVRRARVLLSELGEAPALPPDLDVGDDLEVAGWRLCAMAPLGALDRQHLLEVDDGDERLGVLVSLMDDTVDDLNRILAAGGPT